MNLIVEWKPTVSIVGVNFALAVVNVLYKKALSGGLNCLVSITYRQAISAISLAPMAYFMERKSWPRLSWRIMWSLFLNALFGTTLMLYFFLIGLEHTSTTYSCAFVNMVPVTTFIMALCLGMEKLNMESKSGRAKVVGTLTCIGGALVLTLYKGVPINHPHASKNTTDHVVVVHSSADHDHNAKRWAIGSMFLAIATVAWSSWYLIQARIGKIYPFPYSTTVFLSFFCAVQSAVLNLIVDRNFSTWILKGVLEISTVLYAGIVGSGLCYVVMSWCVKVRGPVFTAAFSPFIQIFASMIDISMLHEQIYFGSILGSTVIIIGLYLLLWGKSNEGETCRHIQGDQNKNEDGNCETIQTAKEPPDTNCQINVTRA